MFSPELLEAIKSQTYHKNSFQCHKCPKEGCPAYFIGSTSLENNETGQSKVFDIQGCSFKINPILFGNALNLMGRNYQAILETNTHITKANERILIHFKKFITFIYAILGKEQTKEITDGSRSNPTD